MRLFFFGTCLLFLFNTSWSQGTPTIDKKKYTTSKIDQAIKIDGIIDESEWNQVHWAGDFTQYQPNDGAQPTYPTNFKIVYNDNFLFVAYRCYDPEPHLIEKRMSRRDGFQGDWVELNIDSYHDRRTGFSFTLSVSGVRGDEFITGQNDWDTNWNPIWWGKTKIDSLGWTAEIQIPLSQLRFGNEEDKVWGFQVTRRLFRKEERSIFQHIPQSAGNWVSEFAELHELKNIKARKQLEVAPYVVAKTESYKPEVGNPFATGKDNKLTLGVDGKLGVTNDLILDFTVNPDFGQVEADPSQVRIDGFQNFFEERRPFFMEGRNIFDFQLTGSEAGGDYDSDLLFYSRRIGSSPNGYPNLNTSEYARIPQSTPILAAAKFSGKTRKGWSIGLLESVTKEVNATIDKLGERRSEIIEPLSNYAVGRIQKDFNQGRTFFGAIVTGVNRQSNLNHSLLDAAYSGGLDFTHFGKSRWWYVKGNVVWSHVNASKEKIYGTQTAFEHLFQRSNSTEKDVNPNLTSLTGTGSTLRIGKIGGKQNEKGQVFKFESGVTYRSPELELNDMGFMLTANEINHFTWAGLQWQKQIGIFRNARINYNHWWRWDFGGQKLYNAFNTNMHGNFINNWRIGTGFTWNTYDVSNTALRGGSSLRRPAGIGNFTYINSDTRKKVSLFINTFNSWGFGGTTRNSNLNSTVQIQPSNSISINIGMGYNYNFRKQDQFVNQITQNNTTKTIVSEVKQNTLRYTVRVNYNITPELTIQYYGQPFITRPKYQHFGVVVDPLNKSYDARFHRFTNEEIKQVGTKYFVDEDNDGLSDYTFSNPDFNFVQFRSNLVARWEYKPGSELYLVWSQGNTPDVSDDIQTGLGQSLWDNAFSSGAKNIFLMKATYRFVR